MIKNISIVFAAFSMIGILNSCAPALVHCTKSKPSAAELAKDEATLLKYYLPQKVLTFYCPVNVKAKIAYEGDKPVFTGNAEITLGDTAFLYEEEAQGEALYIVINHNTKSLMQTNIGLSYYGNGVLKTINAETNNLAIDLAQTVLSMATTASQFASGSFSSVRAETKDTSFKFVINKEIAFSPGKISDTIDFKQYFPKMNNKVFFTISVSKFPELSENPDEARNGFIYSDPKTLRTLVTFHNSNEGTGAVLFDRDIVYPQLGERQILYLPHGFADGKILASFNPDGFLQEVSYMKNKEAPAKLQQVGSLGK